MSVSKDALGLSGIGALTPSRIVNVRLEGLVDENGIPASRIMVCGNGNTLLGRCNDGSLIETNYDPFAVQIIESREGNTYVLLPRGSVRDTVRIYPDMDLIDSSGPHDELNSEYVKALKIMGVQGIIATSKD